MNEKEQCIKSQMAIRDTLDIVGGKWKLILLAVLRHEPKNFSQLSKQTGISPRILSKELQELQINGLVNRQVLETKPVSVEYSLTPYSSTLNTIILEMEKWGVQHREHVKQNF